MNTSVDNLFRNSSVAILEQHKLTEPETSDYPPSPLWASLGIQEPFLLFSITRNPRAGDFCWGLFRILPKENEEIDLDPYNLLI